MGYNTPAGIPAVMSGPTFPFSKSPLVAPHTTFVAHVFKDSSDVVANSLALVQVAIDSAPAKALGPT